MSRLVPDSLVGRAIAILLVGLVVSHVAALALYARYSEDAVAGAGARQTAERIAAIVDSVAAAAPEERRALVRRLSGPGLRVAWRGEPIIEGEAPAGARAGAIRDDLLARLDRGAEVRVAAGPPPAMLHHRRHGPFVREAREAREQAAARVQERPFGPVLVVSVALEDGWLNFVALLEAPEPLWRPNFLLWFSALALAAAGLTVWAVRHAARPLAVFAGAAERLGTEIDAPPLAEHGPREVRRAARAFNEMQRRLRSFVENRTRMLAAVSHDLRTPLTRMRLRAEFIEDAEMRARTLADIAEMERMVGAALAFARGESEAEARTETDLASLLAGLAADARETGAEAAYAGPDSCVIAARPIALKRGFANLLDNAVRYGGRARLALIAGVGAVEVAIDDDGPGIPEAEQSRVFDPFYRIEGSRARESGGSGLGLAIARSAILAHGGQIALANRAEGGLRVTVTLPR